MSGGLVTAAFGAAGTGRGSVSASDEASGVGTGSVETGMRATDARSLAATPGWSWPSRDRQLSARLIPGLR